MPVGWSVSEAASRLLLSESTVRRRIRDGDVLVAEAGPGPLRVTLASVTAMQSLMLQQMGLPSTDQERALEPQPDKDLEIDRLTAEILLLKGAIADLTAAHENVLNTYRRMSDGGIPNN